MSMRERALAFAAVAMGLGLSLCASLAAADTGSGFGHSATAAQVGSWNVDVPPEGTNLPPGSGSVAEGAAVYSVQCAACHGAQGQGGPMDRLVGGQGTLGTSTPVKTIGSYWPYATSVFDYIRRAMPFNKPGTLRDDQVYAVTAYLLNLNDIVPKDARLDAHSLAIVKMPNHDNFILKDPRPDTP